MREICTSGSTRDGASNPPSTLPAPFRAFTLMNDELASRNLRNTRPDYFFSDDFLSVDDGLLSAFADAVCGLLLLSPDEAAFESDGASLFASDPPEDEFPPLA